MPIPLAGFDDLVKNAQLSWAKGRGEHPSVRNKLAIIKSVTERDSEYSSISTMPTARRRDDGDDAYKGEPKQGYTINFTQQEIALQANVTKQMRLFDKYDEIHRRMYGMGKGAERRMELDLASLLSYAWSTSYVNLDGETVTVSAPDGLALISPSHTVNGAATTFSNQVTTTHNPISPSTLEDLEEKFNNFLDDDGRNIPVMPNTIITGRHAPTIHEVKRILRSELEPGTAQNEINTYGGYQHLVVPFLDLNGDETRQSTKNRYVFLADLSSDMNGFCMEVSQEVKFEKPEQVFESSIWQFLTTALYDFGVLRANFIAGTKGDGTAV